jgi:hypothetical protein
MKSPGSLWWWLSQRRNLRAVGAADQVLGIVEQNLRKMNAQLIDLQINCFHPAPPKPERRITAIR